MNAAHLSTNEQQLRHDITAEIFDSSNRRIGQSHLYQTSRHVECDEQTVNNGQINSCQLSASRLLVARQSPPPAFIHLDHAFGRNHPRLHNATTTTSHATIGCAFPISARTRYYYSTHFLLQRVQQTRPCARVTFARQGRRQHGPSQPHRAQPAEDARRNKRRAPPI